MKSKRAGQHRKDDYKSSRRTDRNEEYRQHRHGSEAGNSITPQPKRPTRQTLVQTDTTKKYAMENLPTDFFVTSSAYTPTVYRDQYPAIDPSSPALSQAGKVVIITGASEGIGARGFAPAFAKAKPRAIVLVGRNAAKLSATEANLRKITTEVDYLSIPTDISDEASVAALFQTVKAHYGHADVLINNAGANLAQAPLADVDATSWWADFEVNVKGTFMVTKGFLSLIGTERQGTIVNLSSGAATAVIPGWSSYSISKLAAIKLAEYVAMEYPNVNAVTLQPGVVDTAMVVGRFLSARKILQSKANTFSTESFKRFALDTPALVGGTGVWLATDAARFLTGRFVSANWSVEDLVRRKEEISAGNDLKVVYQGTFGLDQFK